MRILQYNAKGMAQVSFFDLVDVDTVVTDFSILNIVETIDQVCDGCFTGTGGADKRNFLSRGSVEIYVVQNNFSGTYPKSTSSNTTSPVRRM